MDRAIACLSFEPVWNGVRHVVVVREGRERERERETEGERGSRKTVACYEGRYRASIVSNIEVRILERFQQGAVAAPPAVSTGGTPEGKWCDLELRGDDKFMVYGRLLDIMPKLSYLSLCSSTCNIRGCQHWEIHEMNVVISPPPPPRPLHPPNPPPR